MRKKLQVSLSIALMILLQSCSPAPANYCPQPISACDEMKSWLKQNQKDIPICGIIWLKQIGDQKAALEANCR